MTPCGVRGEAEADFSGITIPSAGRAGWCRDPGIDGDGEFLGAEITCAVFA